MAADPLTTSLEEQLARMRGGGELPEALLDVVAQTVELGGTTFTVVRPRDMEGEVAQVDWRERDAFAGGGPWDLVVAADVLYTRRNVEALLRLLPWLLESGGEAVVADPKRAGGRDFLAAGRRMFHIESRPAPARPPVQLHTLRRR